MTRPALHPTPRPLDVLRAQVRAVALALRVPALAALAALAGCGGDSSGGLSAEEERQLNEAAAMLEDNVFDASPDSLVANEAEIEALESAPPPAQADDAANAANVAAEDGAQ